MLKKTLITHEAPHIDEFASDFLLRMLGPEILGVTFTGLEFAKKGFIAKEKYDDSHLCIGVGYGLLDEHSLDGDSSKKYSSAAMLTADYLGIIDDPKYRHYMSIIKYAHTNDTSNSVKMAELGNLLKYKFQQGWTAKEVHDWVSEVLYISYGCLAQEEEFTAFKKQIMSKTFTKNQYEEQMRNFKPISGNFKRFVLPKKHSIDHVLAVKIAQERGLRSLGTGLETEVVFVDPETYIYKKGDLVIGFGDRSFAENPSMKMVKQCHANKKKANTYLLSDYVRKLSIGSRGYHPFELANLYAGLLFDMDDEDYQGAFDWISEELDLFIIKQEEFIDSINEFHNGFKNGNVKIRNVWRDSEFEKRIAVIISDTYGISNVAWGDKFQCDAVILKSPTTGQVIIQTRKMSEMTLDHVVGKLRTEEVRLRGGELDYSKSKLSGTLSESPEWHFQKATQTIFNGGITHPDTPATKLELEFIVNTVVNQCKFIIKKQVEAKRKNNKKGAKKAS